MLAEGLGVEYDDLISISMTGLLGQISELFFFHQFQVHSLFSFWDHILKCSGESKSDVRTMSIRQQSVFGTNGSTQYFYSVGEGRTYEQNAEKACHRLSCEKSVNLRNKSEWEEIIQIKSMQLTCFKKGLEFVSERKGIC